ncbi:TonB-dependent receptor domain-containing protein [Empedobacter tilapiae]|uniref:TonB-dependent receptor domain-containing protein n=1 Tax=Empedobacter tilapiae TaxID=2491114 RepID=UPI0028D869C0|nr:TonB-dependent receptor [Empedobacter tilapiae]
MSKLYIPILLCASTSIFAQQQYKGSLQYVNQTPVSLADVIIIKDDQIIDEISTDEKGNFIVELAIGNYTFRIEEAGILLHNQTILCGQNQDLGVIIIPKTENITLTETVVKSQKKLIEKKVDRLVFNADLAEGARGGDALDLLKLAPRVKVDNDVVSIIGKSTLRVMVDDRLLEMSGDQLTNYLKTLRADDIEKIEVITNPPAKYQAIGNSGILNIVLKSGKKDSWNGSLSSSFQHYNKPYWNNSASFNYRKNKWTLVSNIFGGFGEYDGIGQSDIYFTKTNEVWIERERNSGKNGSIGGKLGLDYKVSDKLTTGFTVDLYAGNRKGTGGTITTMNSLDNNELLSYILNDRNGSKGNTKYNTLNYHVIYKMDTIGKKLTFDFDWVNFNNNNTSVTSNRFFDSKDVENIAEYQGNKSLSDQIANNYSLNIDMEHPINTWKLNYGSRYSWTKNNSDNLFYNTTSGSPVFDKKLSNGFYYDENILAFYGSVEKDISEKWSAKVGLRYENTNANGFSPQKNQHDTYKYDGLFPTAYLMYKAAENHSLSVNVGRRINRAFMGQLNPFRTIYSPYSFAEGNPDLKPSYSYNYELEYAYKDLSITTLYYQNSTNEISQIVVVNPTENTQNWIPYNYADSESFGISENINFKPVKWWKVNGAIDLYYKKTKGIIPEYNYTLDGFNGEFRLTNNLELNKSKTLLFNHTTNYSTKTIDAMSRGRENWKTSLGLKALFLDKKFEVSFNVNNVFKDKAWQDQSYSNDTRFVYTGQSVRFYRVGIRYNFGKSFTIEQSKSSSEKGRL